MKKFFSCEFDIDTACVELKYSDGTMISIDTIAVEDVMGTNMIQQSALDYLIYNKPLEYAQLVLSDGLEAFVKGASRRDYGIQD